jgi:hypothetical protein
LQCCFCRSSTPRCIRLRSSTQVLTGTILAPSATRLKPCPSPYRSWWVLSCCSVASMTPAHGSATPLSSTRWHLVLLPHNSSKTFPELYYLPRLYRCGGRAPAMGTWHGIATLAMSMHPAWRRCIVSTGR